MDAQRIERQVFDSYGFTASKFKEVFLLDTSSDKFGQLNYTVSSTNETAYYLRKNVVERCRNDMALRAMMEEEYEQLLKDRESLRYYQIISTKQHNTTQQREAVTVLSVDDCFVYLPHVMPNPDSSSSFELIPCTLLFSHLLIPLSLSLLPYLTSFPSSPSLPIPPQNNHGVQRVGV
jgi:hypothetical protein